MRDTTISYALWNQPDSRDKAVAIVIQWGLPLTCPDCGSGISHVFSCAECVGKEHVIYDCGYKIGRDIPCRLCNSASKPSEWNHRKSERLQCLEAQLTAVTAERDVLARALEIKRALSPEVLAFARRMQAKLDAHPERGDNWKNEPFSYLFDRLDEERCELEMADMAALADECADVANFAMFIAFKALVITLAEAEAGEGE